MNQPFLISAVLLCGLSVSGPTPAATNLVQSDGNQNTAMGTGANTDSTNPGPGTQNTASGYQALFSNTTGYSNTALGALALHANQTGADNTAVGESALSLNGAGAYNTAVGVSALAQNTSATYNTATGFAALEANSTGNYNAATGAYALTSNQTGVNNTAFGYQALYANTLGKGNAAQGALALYSNVDGIRNLGIGSNALYTNVSGSYNVALGYNAGYSSTGNDNIYINNQGNGTDSQTMRLGTQGTSGVVGSGILAAYIAGVYTTHFTAGSAVYITSSGQLGIIPSSERFKTSVASMGEATDKLARLRPVTFKFKSDSTNTVQYGLIAEEVAKIYPELVLHDADGQISGVRYEELAPMLLNEVQRQQRQLAEQQAKLVQQSTQILHQDADLRQQGATLLDMQRQLAALKQANDSMQAAMASLLADQRMAMR